MGFWGSPVGFYSSVIATQIFTRYSASHTYFQPRILLPFCFKIPNEFRLTNDANPVSRKVYRGPSILGIFSLTGTYYITCTWNTCTPEGIGKLYIMTLCLILVHILNGILLFYSLLFTQMLFTLLCLVTFTVVLVQMRLVAFDRDYLGKSVTCL